jgi:fused signal recognition particle receptor
MFSFIKKKPKETASAEPTLAAEATPTAAPEEIVEDSPSGSLFARLRQSLSKTRSALSDSLSNLILGRKTIDQDLLDDIETQLLSSDVGIEATDHIIQALTQKLGRKQLADPQALLDSLKAELAALLEPCEVPLVIDTSSKPYVILVVGVNGAGKTTTIGKLAKRLQQDGHKIMLAAGDTFRAAAVEQLKVWGERNEVPVVAQPTGSDSASVIFDAYQSAQAKGMDVLIADTAGRLHTKDNLMQELEKIVRVLKKLNPAVPQETLLVLDSTTGQNSLNQARSFHKSVQVTGIALTKLDGTAKGGMVFAIAKELHLPIRFIGVGEKVDDLRPFAAQQFVDALFAQG